jgi:hypothetical protein
MARDMRWWGWGEDGNAGHASPEVIQWFEGELGAFDAPRGPVALDDVRLDSPQLPNAVRSRFAEILRDDREARVLHARGKSYPDLVRQRAGDCAGAPDAVLTPRDHDEVRAVLEACAAAGVAVVPFGGGTSVVGGLEPLRGGFTALVSLDLGALDALEMLDERSHLGSSAAASARSTSTRVWPSAASRSGTCRRATSTSRSVAAWRRGPPGRPRRATGASTISWSACGSPRPRATSSCARSRRARRGPSCGGWSSGPRACSGRSRAWPSGCARCPS